MSRNVVENVKMLPRIRNALYPASGTGQYYPRSAKSIRLFKQGCTNRPFYQVVVMEVCFYYSHAFNYVNSFYFREEKHNMSQ